MAAMPRGCRAELRTVSREGMVQAVQGTETNRTHLILHPCTAWGWARS